MKKMMPDVSTSPHIFPASSAGGSGLASSLDGPEMAELIRWYIGTLPRSVTHLQMCVLAGDRDALRRELHFLQGNAGGYGFGPISDAARCIAKQLAVSTATSGQDAGLIRPLVEVCRSVVGYRIDLEPPVIPPPPAAPPPDRTFPPF